MLQIDLVIISPQVGMYTNMADLGVIIETVCVPGGDRHYPISGIAYYVDCSHPISFRPLHFISRAPRPVFPFTALLRIFDTYCWIGIFISIVSVIVFLKVAAKVGSYYGVETEVYEDFLVPLR
jgi:hypothetical protein